MSRASTAKRSDANRRPTDPRVVALVAYPAVQMLDVAGPADVFAMANAFNVEPAYRVVPVSSQGGLVRASNGIAIDTESIASLASTAIDTLIVVLPDLHLPKVLRNTHSIFDFFGTIYTSS